MSILLAVITSCMEDNFLPLGKPSNALSGCSIQTQQSCFACTVWMAAALGMPQSVYMSLYKHQPTWCPTSQRPVYHASHLNNMQGIYMHSYIHKVSGRSAEQIVPPYR